MADWMPTTDQVRSGYAVDPEGEYRDPINAASNQRAAEHAFTRWMEARDRQVKADTLRGIADTLSKPRTVWHGDGGVTVMTDEASWTFLPLVQWLKSEADRIEKEADHG